MSARQEVAARLMDFRDDIPDSVYKAILESLARMPAERDPAEAQHLQRDLTAQQNRSRQLEDALIDYQDQFGSLMREHLDLQEFSLAQNRARCAAEKKLLQQRTEIKRERGRIKELKRRLHQVLNAINQPGLLSQKGQRFISQTMIPTGVYFNDETLEDETLKAVRELFSTFEKLYEEQRRKRKWDAWDRVRHLQEQIDHLTKKLEPVSAWHLFLHEGTRNIFEIEGTRPLGCAEWGQYWRESSEAFKKKFQQRAQDTWRIVYPHNPKRTTQRAREGYIHCKEDSQEYRTQLGIIEQKRTDVSLLNKYEVDYKDHQAQLEENQLKLQDYLDEISQLRTHL